MNELYDTVIIGGGVTGFSAAMYAGRLKLKTMLISEIRGGTIILTNEIANWPGIKMTDGITLAKQIEDHALEYPGVEVKDAKVVEVQKCLPPKNEKNSENAKDTKGTYFVFTEDGNKFETKTIIFATGTEWRKLGVLGEKEFTGKGVHYCALCDGYFYKNKAIAVIGGADSAAKEALLLTQWASRVYIIYRGGKIRPEPVNMSRIEDKIKQGKMEIMNNTNVKEIKGKEKLTHVILDKPYKGSVEFKIDGIFVEIGHLPNSQLAQTLNVNTDSRGDIIINRSAETNIPGIFAAGDVVDTKFKQAITGAAEGVLAAYSAYEYTKNEIVLGCNDENNNVKKKPQH